MIKKLSELNTNKLFLHKQYRYAIVAILAVVSIIATAYHFFLNRSPKPELEEATTTTPDLVVGDAQFTQDLSVKLIERQAEEIDSLRTQISEIAKGMEKISSEQYEASERERQELQAKLEKFEARLDTGTKAKGDFSQTEHVGITGANFDYENGGEEPSITSKVRTAENYVPAGSFARAVLLSGADTDAGVNGQTNTIPITMRILDDGILPNGRKSFLKGCFVTAAVYGDASSERGQVRLQRLSCIREPGGKILDIEVQGTINDITGSDGVRGNIVMRNQKLLWNAGLSGMMSGFGSAAQQSVTTQTISPLGATSVIDSSKAFQNGMYLGIGNAMSKLADYYIKLADLYHPIIQIRAGNVVTIVFLSGFSLTKGLDEETTTVVNSRTSEKDIEVLEASPEDFGMEYQSFKYSDNGGKK